MSSRQFYEDALKTSYINLKYMQDEYDNKIERLKGHTTDRLATLITLEKQWINHIRNEISKIESQEVKKKLN